MRRRKKSRVGDREKNRVEWEKQEDSKDEEKGEEEMRKKKETASNARKKRKGLEREKETKNE